MEAIVLAGGFGTRLRAVVPDLPKPMAPIAGRPFLAILLERLASRGVSHVVLSIGYLAEKIIAAFGESYLGMDISYCVEEEPLGTGGAIVAASAHCRTDAYFVLNGDTFLEFEPQDLMALVSPHSPFVMTVHAVDDTARYGRVLIDEDHVTGFGEKNIAGAGSINAGVYGIHRSLFDGAGLPTRFSFETDFMMPRVAALRPPVLEANGLFIDIGVPEDYARAQTLFA